MPQKTTTRRGKVVSCAGSNKKMQISDLFIAVSF